MCVLVLWLRYDYSLYTKGYISIPNEMPNKLKKIKGRLCLQFFSGDLIDRRIEVSITTHKQGKDADLIKT